MLSNPSRLFVPSANPADPAFQWRLDLLWQEPSELSKQDHRRVFLDAANEAKSGPLSQATSKTILTLANDDAFRITEIDTAILTVTGWLHNLEGLDQQTRDVLSHHARDQLCKFGPFEEADIIYLLKLNAIDLILKRPLYYGAFLWKGQLCQGSHEPIISKTLSDQVQAVLGRAARPKLSKHSFPYSGLMTCGNCGCLITPELQRKKELRPV